MDLEGAAESSKASRRLSGNQLGALGDWISWTAGPTAGPGGPYHCDVAGAAGMASERPEQARTRTWVENRPAKGRRALRLDEVWRYRELVWFLALRDLKARYKQAAFGVAWAVLQPIAGAAVLTIVFRHLADVPSNGIPYPAFAYLGYTIWAYFSTSIINTANGLVEHSELVTKVYFPREIFPFSAVAVSLQLARRM